MRVGFNPVEVSMIKGAWEYEWSSARYHGGLWKKDWLVKGFEMLGGLVVERDFWPAILLRLRYY